MISNPQTTGSQSQYLLMATCEPMAIASSNATCTSRWMLQDNTVETGTTSRGTGRRLISPALSTIEVVPPLQAMVKKLYGTMPHSTNSGKFGRGSLKILVQTNVMTPIITSGF